MSAGGRHRMWRSIAITRSDAPVTSTPTGLFYYGLSDTNNPSLIDPEGPGFSSQEDPGGNVEFPVFADSKFFVFAYLSSLGPVTDIALDGFNQLGAFTLHPNAKTIGGANFSLLVSNNLLIGAAVSGLSMDVQR